MQKPLIKSDENVVNKLMQDREKILQDNKCPKKRQLYDFMSLI